MQVIRPGGERAAASTTSGRTLSQTLTLLRPGVDDLVDAAFGLALGLVAFLGLATTFSSGRYLAVAALALLLGTALAHLTNRLRWPWPVAFGLALVTNYLLGGAVALREDLVAGVLPSPATIAGLTTLPVTGWKDLLTTVPPVAGDGPYVVLVWVSGLVAGVAGYLLARRSSAPGAALVVPVALLALVILVGTFEGANRGLVGVGATVLGFAWLVVRERRRRTLASTGMARTTRWVSAALLLAVAVAGGVGVAALLPGPHQTPRVVLRTYVQPPLDVEKFPSPLAGFRKYSSDGQRLYDEPLLRVAGAAPGSLVRMAVLDDYAGTVWSASGGAPGDPRSGFRRIGSVIPGAPDRPTNTVLITVLAGYAATSDLNVWLPAAGPATDIQFAGENARDHRASVRYNIGTGQGVVPDRLKEGDEISVTSVALPTDLDGLPAPEGPVVVPPAFTDAMAPAADRIGAAAGDPWSRATEIARVLRTDGFWSNGTRAGEQQYLPGHGLGRLGTFTTELVGSDEHYAASYALMLNALGYPARVVLGGAVGEDEIIRGRDVRAWVEVSLAGRGWVTVPTETFTPSRDKQPNTTPPRTTDQSPAVNVPPPAPVQPPGSFDSLFNTGAPGDLLERPDLPYDWLGLVVAVLRVVGPPLAVILAFAIAVLGLKAWRRHRRRTRGAESTRVVGGWMEYVDRARDLGATVPAQATRLQQASAVGSPEAVALAQGADRVVFGSAEPDADATAGYWEDVMASRAAAVAGLPWWRRWATALNPRSLVPLAQEARARRVRTSPSAPAPETPPTGRRP
ncbi:transglutaminase-like domain-containing protein [Propioniciclava soli]|uniref:transglutaminase-like domain-containing protein n=1 Tax=Propioniciclava soli TaxID=2775081 RepID=UPI001E4FFD37|nr:transglutaminase-like domain-containing protein [Propioniciclava soli]